MSSNKKTVKKVVKKVVRKYNNCNKAKTSKHILYRLLQLHKALDRTWKSLTIDFIVKLPRSKELLTRAIYNSIWVIIERLTKYAYMILYKEGSTANKLAYMFI